jgi:hypothetical protein
VSETSGQPIAADLVGQLAARVRSSLGPSRPPGPPASYDSLHEAAAVLAWFDPGRLRPGDGTAGPAAVEELLSDSEPVTAADQTRRWALSPRIRIAVLRQLRERDRVRAALAANQDRPPDPLQEALEAYLRGPAVPLEEQSRTQLGASYQACEWLREAGFENLPGREEIQGRIDWLGLLQPFQHIAGDHFRGRARELARLRAYVDVLPPESLAESVGRRVRSAGGLRTRKPPLIVHGPGGVGKSALLARFILDHAQAGQKDRFPFVYLDFDRPGVVASEPSSLLVEAVRQLGVEYPRARERCDLIRRDWLARLARDDLASAEAVRQDQRLHLSLVADFTRLIESLGAEDQPVLLVLDTFEEVQWRSEQYVAAIWDLLERLQEGIGRLRVCVSGRGPVPGREASEIELTGLDEEASAEYLRARRVTDPQLARRLARRLGGNPLSLKLAAELFQREGGRDRGLDIDTRGYFLVRLSDAVIQRQLYQRILGHIHDQDVRRLAHPGLVLRRITPDLILHVLAAPCHLDIETSAAAQDLFDALRREVALVSLASDGELDHRPDLRRLMLELLEQDDPRTVRAIRERAVAWYESQPAGRAERAEEIYHRLALGQEPDVIDERWLPGVDPYLTTALPEFHGTRLAYLASRLGLEVDKQTQEVAELEDWERLAGRKALELASTGRPDEALGQLARPERTALSPLFVTESTILATLGRWAEGIAVLDLGIESALAAGAGQQVRDLTLHQAQLVLACPPEAPLDGETRALVTQRLDRLDTASMAPARRLSAVAHRLALAQAADEPGRIVAELEDELRKVLDGMPDETLRDDDQLVSRWAASVFRHAGDAGRLARILRVSGLPRATETARRQAGGLFAQLDDERSRAAAQRPGLLARAYRVPEQDSLTATWSDFLLTSSDAVAGETIADLLERNAGAVPDDLVSALAVVMRSSLGLWTQAPKLPAPAAAPARPPRPDQTPQQLRRELARVLAQLFPTENSLRQLGRFGLDRNFDAYTSSGLGSASAALAVVEGAHREGWLELLLVRAMDRNPANEQLATLARELGMPGIEPFDPDEILADGEFDAYERLPTAGRQVGRMESGGSLLGTGCLVGADLVLTADHVLGTGRGAQADVTVRFDVVIGRRDQVIAEGTSYRLGAIVWRDAELDYALVRVHGSPGVQPIGGGWAGPGGTLRRWIDAGHPPAIQPGAKLWMLQYQQALMVSFGTVIALDEDSVDYSMNSGRGSSGAPCFTRDGELVALHSHATGAANRGVLISAVLRDLRELGLDRLLGVPFA